MERANIFETSYFLIDQQLHRFLSSYNAFLLILGILLIPVFTYAISTANFHYGSRNLKSGMPPPTVPYMFSFLYHLVPLVWNPAAFIGTVMKNYGYRFPLDIRAGFLDFCVVSNPNHIQTIFRSSKQLSSKPSTLYSLKNLLLAPKHAIPFYEADDSGMAAKPRKGSTIKQEDRIHFWQASTAQKYLSGSSLLSITEKYLATLNRNLDGLNIEAGLLQMPDMYKFLQTEVARAEIESMMGSWILKLNPNLIENLWEFDNNAASFIRQYPRWLIPSAYKARERLLESVKKWHAFAHEHSDCSAVEQDDPEWEPYFGSKLIRSRQNYALLMKPMDADTRASEDMGLLFASTANAVPCIFWYLFEALKDPKLLSGLIAEVESCRKANGDFDVSKLANQPLLQSTYAEILRLRIAITISRTNEFEDFQLGGYTIRKNKPILIFSRMGALNEDAWTNSGRPPTVPLEEFWAERFLVDPESAKMTEAAERKFSMEGTAGCWLPYGGGQRMCPGRHFAKNLILGTVAVVLTRYDIEIDMSGADKVKPDMRWFPLGGLPPTCKVPFHMRNKSSKF